jgi:hypothetical protein
MPLVLASRAYLNKIDYHLTSVTKIRFLTDALRYGHLRTATVTVSDYPRSRISVSSVLPVWHRVDP